MTGRDYDVLEMIQLRVSELLWNLFLKRNVEADDLKSGVRSMYVDKLGSGSCPPRIRVLSLLESPQIIPCDTLHETPGCGYPISGSDPQVSARSVHPIPISFDALSEDPTRSVFSAIVMRSW